MKDLLASHVLYLATFDVVTERRAAAEKANWESAAESRLRSMG